MVAMVNSVVAGAFLAIAVARWVTPPALVAVAIGGSAALLVGASFYRHQRRAWNRVDQALPEEGASG